jgi:hypothetical protein
LPSVARACSSRRSRPPGAACCTCLTTTPPIRAASRCARAPREPGRVAPGVGSRPRALPAEQVGGGQAVVGHLRRRARAPGQGPSLRSRDPPARPAAGAPGAGQSARYLVPRGDGRYVLGATQERCGFDTAVTPSVHAAARRASSCPGCSTRGRGGIAPRPGTPDNAPIIGRSRRPIVATGITAGVLLVPVTADLVVAEPTRASRRFGPRFAGPRRDRPQRRAARATARRSSSCWPISASRRPRRRRRRQRDRPQGEWPSHRGHGRPRRGLSAMQGG